MCFGSNARAGFDIGAPMYVIIMNDYFIIPKGNITACHFCTAIAGLVYISYLCNISSRD